VAVPDLQYGAAVLAVFAIILLKSKVWKTNEVPIN
jgi:hypothetical protein